jgi:hypothetical protein
MARLLIMVVMMGGCRRFYMMVTPIGTIGAPFHLATIEARAGRRRTNVAIFGAAGRVETDHRRRWHCRHSRQRHPDGLEA